MVVSQAFSVTAPGSVHGLPGTRQRQCSRDATAVQSGHQEARISRDIGRLTQTGTCTRPDSLRQAMRTTMPQGSAAADTGNGRSHASVR